MAGELRKALGCPPLRQSLAVLSLVWARRGVQINESLKEGNG